MGRDSKLAQQLTLDWRVATQQRLYLQEIFCEKLSLHGRTPHPNRQYAVYNLESINQFVTRGLEISKQTTVDIDKTRRRILLLVLLLTLPAAFFAFKNAQRFMHPTAFDIDVAFTTAVAVAGLCLWAMIRPRDNRVLGSIFVGLICANFALRVGYAYLGANAGLPLAEITPPYIAWLPLVFVLSFVLLQTRLALWLSLAFYTLTAGVVVIYVLLVTPGDGWTSARTGLVQQFVIGHAIYIALLTLIPALRRGYTQTQQEMQALQQKTLAERRLAAIIKVTQDAIILTDLDGLVTDWNPAAETLYGYSAAEMIGNSAQCIFPPELDDAFWRNLDKIADSQILSYNETKRIAKNGEPIDVRVAVVPVPDADGNIIGAASTAHDIRESKHIREVLAQSVQRFRGTFDNAPIGLALVSPEGVFTEVNAALCKIVGYEKEELQKTNFQTITHPDDLDTDLALFGQLTNGEIDTYSLEKRYLHKNGSIVWIVLAVSMVRDAQGQPLHFVAQIEDITQARQTQQTLAERSVELERSNSELEAYARVVSHDLREPLRGISGFTKILASSLGDKLDEKNREYMDLITDSVARSDALINGLLEYARIGSEREIETIDCDQVLKGVLDSLKTQIDTSGAQIHQEKLPAVSANELDVQRVLQNLIGNAIKFSAVDKTPEQGPEVRITAQQTGQMVRFEICDNGPGIPAEFKDEVFQIFRRLHSRSVNGTGIGLAICKKLVESYGGHCGVESEPGEGACFHFTLPAA